MKCENCIHTKPCGEYQQKFLSHLKNLKVTECPYYKEKDKVIHLPCKVGDTVWGVTNSGVFYIKVESIHCFSSGIWKYRGWNGKGKFRTGYEFSFEAIGKTVFLTKEEAEKALKELKE